jgi:hypothetical protein
VTLKLIIQISIFSICASNSFAGIFPASNYDDCILDGVKSAKTDLAVRAVYQACRSKFPESEGAKFKDCSVVWSGKSFIKGSPENINNYQQVGIVDTTVAVFFPKDISNDGMKTIMQNKIQDIKKLCPYF